MHGHTKEVLAQNSLVGPAAELVPGPTTSKHRRCHWGRATTLSELATLRAPRSPRLGCPLQKSCPDPQSRIPAGARSATHNLLQSAAVYLQEVCSSIRHSPRH